MSATRRTVARTFTVFLLAGMILSCAEAGAAQSSPDSGEGTRALAVRYADGRITNQVIGPSGRVSWTPMFPRVAGADTSRDTLPLTALQFEQAVDGRNIVVTIALLYGSPHQVRVKVTSVTLTDENAVRVDELESYGVKPVTLSIVRLPPAQLRLPSVMTPSSQLDARAEAVSGDAPAYHVVIANRSTQAVMALAFDAYRDDSKGERKSVSGRPRGRAHTPLIPPGGEYVLTLAASANGNRGSSSNAWLPLDRVVITSVLWSDGFIEGDPEPAADEHALDAGTAQQLGRVLPLLRAALDAPSSHPLAALRSDVTALPIAVSEQEASDVRATLPESRLPAGAVRSTMQSGMQNVKNAALNSLDTFSRGAGDAGPAAYGEWLAATVAEFDAWRNRIAGPAR